MLLFVFMSAGFADHILNYASSTVSVIERFCVCATSTFPIMCNRLAALCLPNTQKILGRVGGNWQVSQDPLRSLSVISDLGGSLYRSTKLISHE